LLPEFHSESHLSYSFFLGLISGAGIRFRLLPLDFSRLEFLLGLPARESRLWPIFLLDPSVGGVQLLIIVLFYRYDRVTASL
jgi:hypothetical protein